MGHAGRELARGRQPLGLAQPLVEPLALAARPLEHHDDHREGREEIERDEHAVHRHVARRPGHDRHELRPDAMDAPERQEPGQKPLASTPGDADTGRPEQDAGRHLDDAERHADGVPARVAAFGARERQQHGGAGAQQDVPRTEPIVPPVRERRRQREGDGGDGDHFGGEARMVDVQEEHVHQLEALRQRVRAPRHQQVLEEAHAVRGVEVREDQQLDREGDCRDERQDQRRRHQNPPVEFSLRSGASRVPREGRVESTQIPERAFHFGTPFQCGTSTGNRDGRSCGFSLNSEVSA